ncbi:NAD-dependent protein deacylase SRT2, partial [Tanacetum coccineum]
VHHIVSYIVLSRIRSQLFTVFLVVLVEVAATLKFALAAFDERMVERENLSPQQPPRTQHSRYVGKVTSLEYLTRVTVAANTGRMLARYNENNEGLQQLLELGNYTNNDLLLLHPEDEDVISVEAFVASLITVVFFGDNVPKDRANMAMEAAKGCDAFLVLGSSVMTMSAFRLVRAAHEAGAATAIINIGKTRAMNFADLIINARARRGLLLYNNHLFGHTMDLKSTDSSLLLMQILPRLLNTGSLSVPAI